jgi:hypothetical protein
VTADGFERLSEEEAGLYAVAVVSERIQLPGGPPAAIGQITS